MGIGLQHYDIAGTALNAFRTLDYSFRANRREKADAEERAYQHERQAKIDARTDETFDRQKQEWKRDDTDRLLSSALFKTQQYEAAKQQGQDPGQGPQFTPEEAKALGRLSRNKDVPWVASTPSQIPQRISDLTVANQLAGKLSLLPPDTKLKLQDQEVLSLLNRLDGDRATKAHDNGSVNAGYNSVFIDGDNLVAALNVKQPDGSVIAMPATEGASTEDGAPVSLVTRAQFAQKAEGALLANKALAYSLQQYQPQEIYGSKDIEAAIVANGGKGAKDVIDRTRTLNKVNSLIGSDTYKKAAEGQYGDVVTMMGDLAKQGLADEKQLTEALKLVTTKEVEAKAKNDQDETMARTSVLGYAGLGDTMPKTASLARQLQQQMQDGKISGVRAGKMLDLVYAAEQKSRDNAANIAAHRAGRPSTDTSTALIKNADFMVSHGIAKDYNQAYAMLNTAKENPGAMEKTLAAEMMKNNALLAPDEQKTPAEIIKAVREVVRGMQDVEPAQQQPTVFDQSMLQQSLQPQDGPRSGLAPAKPSSKSSKNKANLFFQ